MKTERYSQPIAKEKDCKENAWQTNDDQRSPEFEQHVSELLDKLSDSKFVKVYDKSGRAVFSGNLDSVISFWKNSNFGENEDIGDIEGENGENIFRFGPVDGPHCIDRKRIKEIFQQLESRTSKKNAEIFKKKNELDKEYSELSKNDKNKFFYAKKEAVEIVYGFIEGTKELSELTKEEESLLNRIKTAYEDFKKENSDEKFKFSFASEASKSIWKNFIYRFASNVLDSQKGILDRDFMRFEIKSGTTASEDTYWIQLKNVAVKKLEKSDKFEWGEERIYFDIPIESMKILTNLSLNVAKNEKIAIAFKHLDIQNTTPDNLEDEKLTRFVTNFASVEDAKRFYLALQQRHEYTNMKSDRNVNYYGYNIDGVATYASGFMEKREALNRIIRTAERKSNNTFTYNKVNGSKGTITEKQYYNFKDQFEKLPNFQEIWGKAKI